MAMPKNGGKPVASPLKSAAKRGQGCGDAREAKSDVFGQLRFPDWCRTARRRITPETRSFGRAKSKPRCWSFQSAACGNQKPFRDDLKRIWSSRRDHYLIAELSCPSGGCASGENAIGRDNGELIRNGVWHAGDDPFDDVIGRKRQRLVKGQSESAVGIQNRVHDRGGVRLHAAEILRGAVVLGGESAVAVMLPRLEV